MATAFQHTAAAPTGLLEQLHADHLKVDALLTRFAEDGLSDAEKLAIIQQVYVELLPHAQAEEEIFYPALAAVADRDDVEHAYTEHASAKATIEGILKSDPSDLTYGVKVKMLHSSLKHHIAEEESTLFDEARESGLDLRALGAKVAERKAALKPLFEQQLASVAAG